MGRKYFGFLCALLMLTQPAFAQEQTVPNGSQPYMMEEKIPAVVDAEIANLCITKNYANDYVIKNHPHGTKLYTLSCFAAKFSSGIKSASDAEVGGPQAAKACTTATQAFAEAAKDKAEKCAEFGRCESKDFKACLKHMSSSSAKSKTARSDKKLLEACPYFKKENRKEKEAELKSLLKQMSDDELAMQKLQDEAQEAQEKQDKLMEDADKEIEQHTATYKKLMKELSALVNNVPEQMGNMAQDISSKITELEIQHKMTTQVEPVKPYADYRKSLVEIDQQCRIESLEAVRRYSNKLQGSKGVSRQELQSIAGKHILEQLKDYANSAFAQCQAARKALGGNDAAKMGYEAQLVMLREKAALQRQQIEAAQQQLANIPQEIQKQLAEKGGELQEQINSELETLAKLENNKIKATALAGQRQTEWSQLIGAKQNSQTENQKVRDVLKQEVADSATPAGLPSSEDYSKASSALSVFIEAKMEMSRQCCPCGTPSGFVKTGGVCVSDTERREWKIGSRSSELKSPSCGASTQNAPTDGSEAGQKKSN